MSFTPYLFFSGTCAQAFEQYHEIFGGELRMMRNKDVPPGSGMPDANPDGVMHAALVIGDATLMGSDDPTGTDGAKVGSAVAYTAADESEARRVFDALAKDGEVTGPFGPTFFSKGFGMCTDRFGVPWMVDTLGDPSAG